MKKLFVLAAVIIPLMFAGVSHARNIGGVITEALGGLKFSRNFETVAEHREDSKIPGKSRKILMIIAGKVDCAFDAGKIHVSEDESTRAVRVRLPRAEISRVNIVPDDGTFSGVRVYDEQVGVLASHFTAKEQLTILNEALKRLRGQAAGKWQMLQDIESESAAFITALAEGLGYSAEVVFSDETVKSEAPAKPAGNDSRQEAVR